MFSDRNGTKIEIKNKKVTAKSPNTWEQNNTLLNNPVIKEASQKKYKIYLTEWRWNTSIVVGYS